MTLPAQPIRAIIRNMPQFWHAFMPLFVAFDGVGLLPLFWGLTQRLSPAQREAIVKRCEPSLKRFGYL